MKQLGRTVLKNASANVIRLGAGAAVALVLPPVLTRFLDQDRFAAWALLLQIAAYANFLDFGIQTAVARFVAQAMERGEQEERDGYISTAFFLLSGAALLAFCVIYVIASFLPYIFKQTPPYLLSELRAGTILLAGFTALSLPTSAFTGVFVGLHKNEYPAITSGVARLIGAALVIVAVRYTHSLAIMASLVGAMSLLSGLVLYGQARTFLPGMQISRRLISRPRLVTMVKFCSGLTVMSLAMFLVGGLDLMIVGHFQFSGVAYYAIASNMVLIVAGLANAATNALVAPMATIHARAEYDRLGQWVVKSTRHLTILLVITISPFLLFGDQILTFWVGASYANASVQVLRILVLATAIRLLGGPYVAALIGCGKQTKILVSPLAEGFSNLAVSLAAGYYWGPVGVALGTLVGAIVGLCLHIFYNMPRTEEVKIQPSRFVVSSVVVPTFALLPAIAGIYFGSSTLIHTVPLRLACVCTGAASTLLLSKSGRQLRERFVQ